MNELDRFERMYATGKISREVHEAMVEYYLTDCGGTGPTILGTSIPSSVDPDAPPASRPEEHPGVAKYLKGTRD